MSEISEISEILDIKNSISNVIRTRLIDAGASFLANDNISEYLNKGDVDLLKQEVSKKFESLFSSMLIDYKNDPNTKDTARRMTDMFFDEFFAGRYQKLPRMTEFPNSKNLDEIYTLGPIKIVSMCSHHILPITGEVWLGILPSEKIVGISKFNRLIEWVMSRPQIQEEAVVMIADTIEKIIKPKGLAVVIKASHACMTLRGVKDENTSMTNSIMRGEFKNDVSKKAEFFNLIKSQGFSRLG